MVTPYLKPFNDKGGTLYVFPSVSKDLTRTSVSNDYEFKFSHFACLNIPDIYTGKYKSDKGFYIDTLILNNNGGYYTGYDGTIWSSGGIGKTIAENLQNYVMNFETAILNGEGDNDDYDNDILTNVSEKVFFNWLQKVGAIKFTESGTLEAYNTLADRTVQYIGNLDVMNTVDINGDSFEELYIHIPSTAGASTSVYFRTGESTDNKNYLNKNYNVSNGTKGSEYIIGRDSGDADEDGLGRNGLSIKAIYDLDQGANIYTGDIGHTIDFRDSSYAGGDGISTMNGNSLNDFEFNAVLIYYDILQKTSTKNVKKIATNLYGILFLDQPTPLTETDRKGYFQRYPKKKETVYGNGNSYALKLDLKIDTVGDSNTTYIEVPDENYQKDKITSFILYNKAIEQLQKCIDVFYTQKNEIVKLTERVSSLENLVMGIDTVSSIKDQVNRLYSLYESNAVVDTSSLLSLIDSNTRKLENIMNGGKDIKLQFDTDVLQAGEGIGMIKTQNKVIINSEQRYSMNEVINGTDKTEINSNNTLKTTNLVPCEIKLKPGENFAVIYFDDQGTCTSNLNIDIDDSECNWQAGQSLKIYFYGEYGSISFDDRPDIGVVITPKSGVNDLIIEGSEFEGNNLIEIICVEKGIDNNDKFIYLINK